jgi:hypothetical protein
MRWKSTAFLILLIAVLLVANSWFIHISTNELGDLILLIALGFYIEQSERRLTERLDRIEALIRDKVGNNI